MSFYAIIHLMYVCVDAVERHKEHVCEYSCSGPYIVAFTAELPEGLDVKPGALVPRWIQRHTHGVLLQQSW